MPKCRLYIIDDVMIYEGMIFKANHTLFEVSFLFFNLSVIFRNENIVMIQLNFP
jgi:hypothetical protein